MAAAVVAAAVSASPVLAGAWPQNKGDGLAIFTYSFDSASRRFDDDGDAAVDVTFTKQELSAYLEYGLTSRVTLVGRPVIQSVRSKGPATDDVTIPPTDEAAGLGGTEAGARFLLGRPFGGVVSFQGVALIPGDGENAVDEPLGEGGFGGEVRLLAGASWGWRGRGGFADAQVGARSRGDVAGIEGRVDVTVGVRPSPDWMWLGQSFTLIGEESAETTPGAGRQDVTSHKVRLSGVRRLNRSWAVQGGVTATVAGRNIIEERAAMVALWRRF